MAPTAASCHFTAASMSITGWRNTGKSSLLEIVDYCFGRSTLTVSRGKIRRTVGWYGLSSSRRRELCLRGSACAAEGPRAPADAIWLPLADAEPPEPAISQSTRARHALREELSSFSSLRRLPFRPATGMRPVPRCACMSPTSCRSAMQDEEDIDSKTRLFHRGQDREVMQALRDALALLGRRC